ncbi:MAG: helix-turn-helix domain-containing protein [Pseudobdellovibrionaceae bacterium]
MGTSQKIKLAENLNRLMNSKNLTVTSVARKIGMNKSTLHNYSNGVIPRNLPKIKELADLLEVSLSELVFGHETEVEHRNLSDGIEGKFEVTIRRVDRLSKGEPKR